MFLNTSTLAIGLVAALVVGGAVGCGAYFARPQGGRSFAGASVAILVFVIGLIIAALLWPPMHSGFWLEAALLMFAVYVIGILVGGLLRKVLALPAEQAPTVLVVERKEPELACVSAVKPTLAPEANDAQLAPTAPADPPPAAEAKASETASPTAPASHPAPAAESPATPEPQLIDRVEGEEKHQGARPLGYGAPPGGVLDDLRRIKGIGPQNEARLHALGVWRYSQIAAWNRANVQWIGGYLSFPGRVDRERWVEQATKLAAEPDADKRAQRGDGSEDEIANLRKLSGVSDARLKRR